MGRVAITAVLIITVWAATCSAQFPSPARDTANDKQTREVDEALRPLATGNTEQALTALRSIAEKGNVKAQILLGRAYGQEGLLVKQADYAEAMKWYKRASAQGSGEGSVGVAELFEQGLGVPQSSEEAKVWWELAAKQGYDQQELDLRCFTRVNGSDSLSCKPWQDGTGCPSEAEMQALVAAGVTGHIRPTGGGGGRHRLGPKARAILVLDHPVSAEERLKQPRHTNVIYVQHGNEWELLPKDAPLLDRPIVVYPQADRPWWIIAGVQDVDGSISAGGCASWPPTNHYGSR